MIRYKMAWGRLYFWKVSLKHVRSGILLGTSWNKQSCVSTTFKSMIFLTVSEHPRITTVTVLKVSSFDCDFNGTQNKSLQHRLSC